MAEEQLCKMDSASSAEWLQEVLFVGCEVQLFFLSITHYLFPVTYLPDSSPWLLERSKVHYRTHGEHSGLS